MDKNLETKYLKELGNGSHEAFDKLFLYHYPRVRRFLTSFVKDDEQASDMAQDLFFKIWVRRSDISKVQSFKAYLFEMAKNRVYDYFDHHLICEKYASSQFNQKHLFEDFPEEEIHAHELSILIDLVIEKMPDQRKRIFNLSRKQGLSNDAIATELQISKRTVENHITQALSDIRTFIKNASYFFI